MACCSQRPDTLLGFGNRRLSLGQRSFLFDGFLQGKIAFVLRRHNAVLAGEVRQAAFRGIETAAELLGFLVKES